MSYTALVDKQIAKAFRMVKDLAVDAVFTKTTAATFDFNAGTASQTTIAPTVVKLVPLDEKKPNKQTNTIVLSVMGKGIELGDLNSYDTISFQGHTWKIGNILKQTGRVWLFELYREA